MAKAIEQLRSGLIAARALLGRYGAGRGSVRQGVHDGDTLTVEADGNLGVRFLGVDAPEISFTLPNSSTFVNIGNENWSRFLSDPFAPEWRDPARPPLEDELGRDLKRYLRARLGPDTAANHFRHAQAAEDELEALAQGDMDELGKTKDTFRFFIAFAHDVMDRYGRLLGYIHPDQPETQTINRKRSYNERLLEKGKVLPYFIWPNVDPFRRVLPTLEAAVPPPGHASLWADQSLRFRQAREWVRNARQNCLGIFSADDPLKLESFELRYLARQSPPDRWLIDLSSEAPLILRPEKYFLINAEDRLWIPNEFVPLFLEKGWRKRR